MKYIFPVFFIVFTISITPYCFHLLKEDQQHLALSSDISFQPTVKISELNLIELDHISSDFVITSIIIDDRNPHIITDISVSPLNDPSLIYKLRFNNYDSQDDFISSLSSVGYDKFLGSKIHIVGSTFIWPAVSSCPTLILKASSTRFI